MVFYIIISMMFAIAFAFKYYDYKQSLKLRKEILEKFGEQQYKYAESIGMFKWF